MTTTRESFENRRTLVGTWLAMVLVTLLLTACGQKAASDQSAEDEEKEVVTIPVETMKPHRADINAVYSGTAPIEAFAEAMVVAKVGGEVKQIFVEEGDDVPSGAVLARLDGDRLRFELNQVEANLRKLERDFQRNLDLREKSLISAGDFEKIQYELEALKASYNLAKLELNYTEIRAPIKGVVSERFIKVGNVIDVNAATFMVTSLEPLVSYLHAPEREYGRIRTGQTATLQIDALQSAEFVATVARVSPVIDSETGTFKITIEVSDDSRRLKPGMFGRISIVYDSRADALQIPRGAIIEENGESSVFVIDGDQAQRRGIRTGYIDGPNIEVLDGLDEGEEFVIVGQTSLKSGSTVSIINAANTNEGRLDVEEPAP